MTTPLRTRFRRARRIAAHAVAWSVGRTADHVSRLGDRIFDAAAEGSPKNRPTSDDPGDRHFRGGVCRAVARCCDHGGNALIRLSELLLREPRSGWSRPPRPRGSGERIDDADSTGDRTPAREHRSPARERSSFR